MVSAPRGTEKGMRTSWDIQCHLVSCSEDSELTSMLQYMLPQSPLPPVPVAPVHVALVPMLFQYMVHAAPVPSTLPPVPVLFQYSTCCPGPHCSGPCCPGTRWRDSRQRRRWWGTAGQRAEAGYGRVRRGTAGYADVPQTSRMCSYGVRRDTTYYSFIIHYSVSIK